MLEKIKRVCLICGKVRYFTPYEIKQGKGKFCSRKCQGRWRSKHLIGRNNPGWKGGKVKQICKTCGKVRYFYPSEIKNGRGKFCSQKCLGRWFSKHRKGKSSTNWKGGSIKRICEECGIEFPTRSSEIKRSNGKFCSPECYGKWQSKHRRGENSPSWKNGASFEPYCEKFNYPFKEYIRDKFGRVCFLCQKTEEENGQRLSVHHVNYNKNCGCDGDKTCQFVPLCISCNAKVNFNREMWEKKIKAKMRNKLNGWVI